MIDLHAHEEVFFHSKVLESVAFSRPEDTEAIKEAATSLLSAVGQLNVAPINGTELECFRCHCTNADAYRLRKSGGKYIALCIWSDGGCAGKEVSPICNYKDSTNGFECESTAEYEVRDASDNLLAHSCGIHISVFLSRPESHVYPLR